MAEVTVFEGSLKAYKKEIEDLKGTIMKLKDADKDYSSQLDELTRKQKILTDTMNAGKQAVAGEADSYNALSQKLSAMKAEWKTLSEGSDRFKELQQEIANTTEKLSEMDASVGTFSRNVGNYEGATVSLKSQLREMQMQLAEMLANGVSPTDAAFQEMAKRAGDLKDAMADAQAVVGNFANDTKTLANITDVAKTGVAAFGAYNGVLSIFGGTEKKTSQEMVKLQAIMTTLNSLQTIQTALVDRASATHRIFTSVLEALGLKKKANATATIEETTAEKMQTASTEAQTAATEAETVATEGATLATNGLKAAIISTGIGALVILVISLVEKFGLLTKAIELVSKGLEIVGDAVSSAWTAFTDFIGVTSEEEREAEKAAEAERERAKQLNEVRSEAVASLKSDSEMIAKLLELQKRVNDTTLSEKERIKAMQDANEESGKEIYNLKETNKYLEGSDKSIKAYIQNMIKEAEAKALLNKIGEIYLHQLEVEEEVRKNGWGPWAKGQLKQATEDLKFYKSELEKIQSTLVTYKDYSSGGGSSSSKSGGGSSPSKSGGGSSPSKSGGGTKPDILAWIDVAKEDLDETISKTEYLYDLMKAEGKLTTADELAETEQIYKSKKDYYDYVINRLEEQKKKYKENSEDWKKIVDAENKYSKEKEQEDRDYTVKTEEEKRKIREEQYDKQKKNFEDNLKQFDKSLKAYQSNVDKIGSSFNWFKEDDLKKLEKAFNKEIVKIQNNKGKLAQAIGSYAIEEDKEFLKLIDRFRKNDYGFDFKQQKADIEKLKELTTNGLDTAYDIWHQGWQSDLDDYNKKLEEFQAQIDAINTKISETSVDAPEYTELHKQYDELSEIISEYYTNVFQLQDVETAKAQTLADEKVDIEEDAAKRLLAIDKQQKETTKKTIQDTISAYGDLAGGIADYYESIIDLKVKNGEMSEEEAEKEFERVKTLQISQAVIGMIGGAVGAYFQDMKSYPSPWNAIVAVADMATVFTTGMAQINKIRQSEYSSSSSSDGGSVSSGVMSASVTPLLDEELDQNSMSQLNLNASEAKGDTRVWILESDIDNAQNKVAVRESESSF